MKSLLELKSQNDIDLHVEEVKKRKLTKKGDIENNLSDFGTHNNGILEDLKNGKKIPDYMVYRMDLPYDEVLDILDIKYIPWRRMGYTLTPGISEIIDRNSMLKSLLPLE